MNVMKIFLGGLMLFSHAKADVSFVVDLETGAPIEGAVLYLKEQRLAFRSDVNGKVELPEKYNSSVVAVFSKNYLDAKVELPIREIKLKFDDALMNEIEREMAFTRADTLRGAQGAFRKNNDLLFYDLNIRVDVANKYLSGWNTVRFEMLENSQRIQLDLFQNMQVDSIVFAGKKIGFTRAVNAVFIEFPEMLQAGKIAEIDFHYSGYPKSDGRFGGFTFSQDSLGAPWVFTACQNIGASLWWPNKDQQPDEPDSMKMHIEIPADLVDVSNGRFLGKEDLGDGFVRYNWSINYPINNYSVSVNIAPFVHFSERFGDLTLDYYVQPYNLQRAKEQFKQVVSMLACFESKFGPYPFPKDGYKLIEAPYLGMEHQSAVTYGNGYQNGYSGQDWTGVGISTKFDFIIVHESGHEWFGNSVTANDVSDAWIHEGWCTYTEGVYVECLFGYEESLRYLNGYKSKIKNKQPIIGPTAVNRWPTSDQYFKGALFLNTLRHVVNDEQKWASFVRLYTEHFKCKNIFTTDVVNFFNERLDRDFMPIFRQYLYEAQLPVLQLKFSKAEVQYRWQSGVSDFNMPVMVRTPAGNQLLNPVSEWQSVELNGVGKEDWQVATDLFYIETQEL